MRNALVTSDAVRRAYQDFLTGSDPASGSVRSLVRESWTRSADRGVNPSEVIPVHPDLTDLDDADFVAYRDAHPMSAARPLVRSLMLDDIDDFGGIIALTDERGRLLWVEGSAEARRRASRISFVEGTVWSEDAVGTNAPGLALAIDRGVQVVGPEHFSGPVQTWNCAAAPVHDPRTNKLIGVVDVTGGPEVATPFALATVRSVVAAVERELSSRAVDLTDPATYAAAPTARLTVLADSTPRWAHHHATRSLSRRHAEILLLLQAYPDGLSTEQLALMLADGGVDAVTVRAEISRLRRDLGSDVVDSRPYRLTVPLESDLADLRGRLAAGEIGTAIEALGRGGLLAESTAPGIVELFDEVREDVRSRLITSGTVAQLRAWTASVHGRDDALAWQQLATRMPADHPDRAVVAGRLRLLDRRLGL